MSLQAIAKSFWCQATFIIIILVLKNDIKKDGVVKGFFCVCGRGWGGVEGVIEGRMQAYYCSTLVTKQTTLNLINLARKQSQREREKRDRER